MISVNNYSEKIQGVNLQALPKVLLEGHEFFLEANAWYKKDQTVTESIDLYIQKLNDHLKQRNDAARKFITKFLRMHNQVKTKHQLGLYIKSLQKAILEKSIRKSSLLARHIAKIQEVLINQYNTLPDNGQVKININDSWKKELELASEIKVLNGIDTAVSEVPSKPKRKKSLFDSMNEIDERPSENSFRLAGDLGMLLGDLERFELAITLEGDQGGGKTRFSYQLANAFAVLDMKVAIFSLEIGRKSDLVRRMREEYLEAENRNNIFITDQLPDGFDTIRKAANDFDIIVIDSWNKLHVKSSEFDRLRKEFPNTIFIIIFQRTTQGTIRGGTAPLFDAGINLEVVKVDDTFINNYAVATKNRYGATGIQYNVTQQKIIDQFEPEVNGEGI
ncbi:antirestriction protein [Fulvivirga sp. RKSG066]|uniref:antirestriction protein n=1 Tax=Fulvivirga aurantia TaxID=2529383 RepID=UPI0012BC51C2|nr:antirestriction protein [Fulvivirga aurantia]MTI21125.1 antirestriction protein [Fulvivirga aurantia]